MPKGLFALCSSVLKLCLPRHIADILIGDLYEEYCERQALGRGRSDAWLLSQTWRSIWPFVLSGLNAARLLLLAQGLALFTVLAMGIMYLSGMEDGSHLSEDFWLHWSAGRPHQLFWESDFWRFAFAIEPRDIGIQMWLAPSSMLYAALAWYLIRRLDQRFPFSLLGYFLLSLVLLVIPYIWGSFIMIFLQPEIRLTGPIVVSMWFPTLYLVLPFCGSLASRMGRYRYCA